MWPWSRKKEIEEDVDGRKRAAAITNAEIARLTREVYETIAEARRTLETERGGT